MANWTRKKAIDVVKKLLNNAKSEREDYLREGTAELFENKANQIMKDYSISKAEVDNLIIAKTQTGFTNELGYTLIINPFNRINQKNNLRKLWFEELAKLIAETYTCKINVDLQTANITFYGYDLDREIAVFIFTKLSEQANELCLREMKLAKSRVGKPAFFDFKSKMKVVNPKIWYGDDEFIDNFHLGFRESLEVIYLKNKAIDEQKLKSVNDFFETNKNNNSYNYWYSYRNQQQLKSNEIVESAREVGRICGRNVAFKATKNISALTATNKKAINNNANVVYILIDASGSMWGDKLVQAKEGLIDYAKSAVAKGYEVGVIAFGSNINHPIKPTNKIDDEFESIVNGINDGGGTNLKDALLLSQGFFVGRQNKRTLMIITDGEPTGRSFNPKEECSMIAKNIKRQGIEIQAIGTYDVDKEFIDKLVSKEGLGMLCGDKQLKLTVGSMAINL